MSAHAEIERQSELVKAYWDRRMTSTRQLEQAWMHEAHFASDLQTARDEAHKHRAALAQACTALCFSLSASKVVSEQIKSKVWELMMTEGVDVAYAFLLSELGLSSKEVDLAMYPDVAPQGTKSAMAALGVRRTPQLTIQEELEERSYTSAPSFKMIRANDSFPSFTPAEGEPGEETLERHIIGGQVRAQNVTLGVQVLCFFWYKLAS